ncbi:MAG: TetR/AcrR family transcriptional regulator [Firmicutes bacterium]|nr:TetR/AcrR family transcriptional regulator [Bacillota bacterium]
MSGKVDPRILRTRKLIMDAFIELATKKDFKDITIKDIASVATVNRATFYDHFLDKYDLLEKVLAEKIMTQVVAEVRGHDQLTEQTIQAIFLSLVQFLTNLASQCRRSYETFSPMIEATMKKQLEQTFHGLMRKQWPHQSDETLRVGAVMFSWALYGAVMDWMKTRNGPPEEYMKQAIYFVQNGLRFS